MIKKKYIKKNMLNVKIIKGRASLEVELRNCSERMTASYRSDVIAYLTPIFLADFTTPKDLPKDNLKL